MLAQPYLWFLDSKMSKVDYDRQLQEMYHNVKHLIWRQYIGVAVDTRRFSTYVRYQDCFRKFDSSWKDPYDSNWDHYQEVTGKGLYRIEKLGKPHLRMFECQRNQVIDIPFDAIVSSRSTGYPKVAYSADEFLMGFISVLNVLDDLFVLPFTIASSHYDELMSWFHPDNFSKDIFPHIKALIQDAYKAASLLDIQQFPSLKDRYELLIHQMIDHMEKVIPTYCRGMYHNMVESKKEIQLLPQHHPILVEYRRIRKDLRKDYDQLNESDIKTW
jgi:hypothetical protein